MSATSRRLCALDEIEEPGSRAFRLDNGEAARGFFIVRHAGRVVAYRNTCPHVGSSLDWIPGRFLDIDRRLILCATHGALFRIEDGACVSGPCAGKALKPVAIRVEDGAIYLDDAGAEAV